MVRKSWLYYGNIHVFSTIFYSFNKQRTLFSILSNEDEQYREIDRYMHRSCMSNRIWGLKQNALQVNGHACFSFTWTLPSREERKISKK